jgi:glycerol-3-phosphate dehydrogenase
VGVWHKVYDGHPDGYNVTEEELEAFCKEVNDAYPSLRLSRSDISLCNAGLIPFGENDPNAKDLKFGHRSRLVDHARLDHLEGLVTLIGVRYTTGQCEAVKAVDLIVRKLGKSAPPSRSHTIPLHGGDFNDFESLVRAAFAELRGEVKVETVRALIHNYGSGYRRVVNYVTRHREKAQTIGSSTVLEAEVVGAVRDEMAQTLADVVFRRTDLGTGEYPGSQALERCAELMSIDLHWDEERKKQEIENVTARFPATGRLQEKAAPWKHDQIPTVKR